MFDFLPEVCRELRNNLVQVYWMMIVPLVVFLVVLEFFKIGEETPRPMSIIHRALLSILLLLSFEEFIHIISMVGDGITRHINGLGQLTELLNELQKNYESNSPSWLKFRDALIFVINLLSYFIAYIGIFMTNIMLQFVWSILFVVSPLMILMYISPNTSHVTANLFKGLINVIVWKILWSILGVMLLKFAVSPEIASWDNFFTTALVNICIGVSMIFVPFATKSLIGNGLTGAASALAMIPSARFAKNVTKIPFHQNPQTSQENTMQRDQHRGRTLNQENEK